MTAPPSAVMRARPYTPGLYVTLGKRLNGRWCLVRETFTARVESAFPGERLPLRFHLARPLYLPTPPRREDGGG